MRKKWVSLKVGGSDAGFREPEKTLTFSPCIFVTLGLILVLKQCTHRENGSIERTLPTQ